MSVLSEGRPCAGPSSWRSGRKAGASGSSARPAGWSCPRGRRRTPRREPRSATRTRLRLEPGSLSSSLDVAGHLGALVGLQVIAGAGEHLDERLGNPVRPCRFQHLLDLARGPAVRIALDGDDDALPDRQVVGLQRRADRGRRPELHRPLVVGRAARPRRSAGGARAAAASRRNVRQSTSPRLLQHRDRHRQAPLPDLGPVGLRLGARHPMSCSSDGCGSASRRTSWVATHCFLDGSPQ